MSVAGSQGLFPQHRTVPLIFSSIFVLLCDKQFAKLRLTLCLAAFSGTFSHRAFSKHLFYHTVMAYCYSWLIQVSLTVEKSSLS